jgi:hypothetical protein
MPVRCTTGPVLVLVALIVPMAIISSQAVQPTAANSPKSVPDVRFVATQSDFAKAIVDESEHIVLTQHLHLGGLTSPIRIGEPTISLQVRSWIDNSTQRILLVLLAPANAACSL